MSTHLTSLPAPPGPAALICPLSLQLCRPRTSQKRKQHVIFWDWLFLLSIILWRFILAAEGVFEVPRFLALGPWPGHRLLCLSLLQLLENEGAVSRAEAGGWHIILVLQQPAFSLHEAVVGEGQDQGPRRGPCTGELCTSQMRPAAHAQACPGAPLGGLMAMYGDTTRLEKSWLFCLLNSLIKAGLVARLPHLSGPAVSWSWAPPTVYRVHVCPRGAGQGSGGPALGFNPGSATGHSAGRPVSLSTFSSETEMCTQLI